MNSRQSVPVEVDSVLELVVHLEVDVVGDEVVAVDDEELALLRRHHRRVALRVLQQRDLLATSDGVDYITRCWLLYIDLSITEHS